MQNNFYPLSEVQKMLVFSPIKTYRLFAKLKQEGRFREEQDWIMRDQKLFIDLPRFVTELEVDGHKNIVQADFIDVFPRSSEIIRNHMKSSDIERNQSEITAHEKHEEKSHADDPSMKSDEIIRNQVKSNENDIKSVEYKLISAEILQAKDEVIGILKESLRQANQQLSLSERDKEHYRKQMDYISLQNQRLTQLTYMLTGPKRDPVVREASHNSPGVYTGPEGAGQEEEMEAVLEQETQDATAQDEELPREPLPEEESVHVQVASDVTGKEEEETTPAHL